MLRRAILITTAGFTFVLALGLPAAADAAVIWNETVKGDFSNDGLAPTMLGSFINGDNEIIGTTGRSAPAPAGEVDRDYFTFTVPQGLALVAIKVVEGTTTTGPEGESFIGIAQGTRVTVLTTMPFGFKRPVWAASTTTSILCSRQFLSPRAVRGC